MMKTPLLLCVSVCVLTACDDDEDDRELDEATIFELRIENVAPWNLLKSAPSASKVGGTFGPAKSGEVYEIAFTAGIGQSINFATMLWESNDWFFAPVTSGIPLYDANHQPISGDVTRYVSLWDAGTEFDQEPGLGESIGSRQPAPGFGAPDANPAVREVPIDVRLHNGTMFVRPQTADMIRVTLIPGANRTFRLQIANVSNANTLVTSQGNMPITIAPLEWALHTEPAPFFNPGTGVGARGLEQLAEDGNPAALADVLAFSTGVSTPIAPGVIVLHLASGPLFFPGELDRGLGLEALAEDGNNTVLASTLPDARIEDFGTFDIPAGASDVQSAIRGQAYVVEFNAFEGDRLSFATSFGMSNDWFFAVRPEGIQLFIDDDDEDPISGDVTDQIAIYDLGTEVNQELAVGADIQTQQTILNSGAPDPFQVVREVDAAVYPALVQSHLRVTVTPLANLD